MNSRSGCSARLIAVVVEIWWALSGSTASRRILLMGGAITKIVRNRAIPTSTWLGGALLVPTAVRMKPSTIRMRLKPVTVNSTAGISESPPTSSRICTALEELRFTCAPPNGSWARSAAMRAGDSLAHRPFAHPLERVGDDAREGGARLAGDLHRAYAAAFGPLAFVSGGRWQVEQAGGARLLFGVAVDRGDAVLGGSDEQVVAPGAHEVQGAARPERQRGE